MCSSDQSPELRRDIPQFQDARHVPGREHPPHVVEVPHVQAAVDPTG